MSYAIGYIVYGIDLTACSYGSNPEAYEALKDLIDNEDEYILSEHVENETQGFESRYSGGGDQPQWFGVEISNIDECKTVDGERLARQLVPTDEVKAKYQALLDGLDDGNGNAEFNAKLKSLTRKS